MTTNARATQPRWLAMTIGLSALVFSALYLAADVVQVAQGGFGLFGAAGGHDRV